MGQLLTSKKGGSLIIEKLQMYMLVPSPKAGRPSLLTRVINKVDVYYEAGQSVSETEIGQIIQNCRYDDQQFLGQTSFTQSSSSRAGNFVRGGSSNHASICNDFNSASGCTRGSQCKYEHICQRHYNSQRKRFAHSEVNCKLSAEEELISDI